MAKLPKNIIKKYGISKKAWAVFRGGKNNKMVKHKRTHHFGKSKGMSGIFGTSSNSLVQVDAMAYGAERQYVSNLIQPVTSMIPLGAYAYEVGMGLVDWLIAKNVKGFIGDLARKGLVVENAHIGMQIMGGVGLSSSSTPSYFSQGGSY